MSQWPRASSDRKSASGVTGKSINSACLARAADNVIPGQILDGTSGLTWTTVRLLPLVSIRTRGLPCSAGRRRQRRSVGQDLRCAHSTCFTVHLQKKDLSGPSSVTVEQLDLPTLRSLVAG